MSFKVIKVYPVFINESKTFILILFLKEIIFVLQGPPNRKFCFGTIFKWCKFFPTNNTMQVVSQIIHLIYKMLFHSYKTADNQNLIYKVFQKGVSFTKTTQ